MKQIHYAPLIGGIVNYDTQTAIFRYDTTIEQFLKDRKSGKIKHTNTQRQGHPIFHGQVDIYVESEESSK